MGEVADLERKLATANLQVDKSIKRVRELEARLSTLSGWLTDPRPESFTVLDEVLRERIRQDMLWGEQNPPNVSGHNQSIWQEGWERRLTRTRGDEAICRNQGSLGWDLILLEEVYEALSEPDPVKLREELVQVAAVAVAWIEALDRREAREQKGAH